ncbi:MAG: DUF4240 domain-containing protein [Bacteroidota bacterium]
MITLVIGLILIFAISFYFRRKDVQTMEDGFERRRKETLAHLIENRETRTLDYEFDEAEFWTLIERIGKRSKQSYKNSVGLFKDFIGKYDAAELIGLDNLLVRLYKEYVTQDVCAAAAIILSSTEPSTTLLLMNVLISRGEVFFKQACHNPNLIIGKAITDIENITYADMIAEVYFLKADKFIPLVAEAELAFEIPGEPWAEKDLPSRYRELWMAFA